MKRQKKEKKKDIRLRQEEERELDAIIERLEVQNPEGETFETFISTLRDRFQNREMLLALLLDRISKSPSSAGLAVFKKLYGNLENSGARKIVRRARYRLEQKGISLDEEQEERVVRVGHGASDVSESPEAYIWREKVFSYRTLEIEFPPRGKEERVFIICEEDRDLSKLVVGYMAGSRRLVRETRDILNRRSRFRVPVSVECAVSLFNEYVEVYKDRATSQFKMDLANARKFIAGFTVPKVSEFLSRTLPETDIGEALRNVARICAAAGPYDFLGMDCNRCVDIFKDVILSRLDYPKRVMTEVLEERIAEYLSTLDRWVLGRYRMFLEDGVLEWIHRGDEVTASCLYQIAEHINYEGLSRVVAFLLKHLLSSLYYWTTWYEMAMAVDVKNVPDVLGLSESAVETVKTFRSIVEKGKVLFDDVLREVSKLSNFPGTGWAALTVVEAGEGAEREASEGRYRSLDSGLIVLG